MSRRAAFLTSAAAALDIQLVDGRGHITEADTVALFTNITVHRICRWCSVRLCQGEVGLVNHEFTW